MNGVEQSASTRDEHFLPPPPPYPGPSSQPPPPPPKESRRISHDRDKRHTHERRTSEPQRYAPPPNPPPDGPVIPPTNHYNPNHYNSANDYYQAPQGQYAQPAPYDSGERQPRDTLLPVHVRFWRHMQKLILNFVANVKRDRDYDRVNSREQRRRHRDRMDEREEPYPTQRRKWWNRW